MVKIVEHGHPARGAACAAAAARRETGGRRRRYSARVAAG